MTEATHRGPGDGVLQSAELGDQLRRLVLLRDGRVLGRERVPDEREVKITDQTSSLYLLKQKLHTQSLALKST